MLIAICDDTNQVSIFVPWVSPHLTAECILSTEFTSLLKERLALAREPDLYYTRFFGYIN